MRTEWFVPGDEFLRKAVDSQKVTDYLEQVDYEAPVYVVTGIKTVRGASVTILKSKAQGWRAALGLDTTAVGAPVSIGPEAEHDSSATEYATFENSSHIVFAFQLMEMRCDEEKAISVTPYTTGALLGLDVAKKDTRKTTDTKKHFFEEELKQAFGDRVTETFDEADEEECFCVIPGRAPAAMN
jgi:hypothetical protein